MIFYHHYKNLKEELDSSKKMEYVKHKDFRVVQTYLEDKLIERCRIKIRIRTNLLKTFKDNFCNNNRQKEIGPEDSDPGLQCNNCLTHARYAGPLPDVSCLGATKDRTRPERY